LAGRGWGKTRTGAETVRAWARDFALVNLIGPTADDARDIMVEGESGILAVCPKGERPTYRPSKRRLDWPNGAKSLIFTADEPERLRGKQHMKFWADEVGAWRYATEAWDHLELGLRLGSDPQGLVTTTPRATKVLKMLFQDPRTLVTQHSTEENAQNVSPKFLRRILDRFEGTRLGRQEIHAEMLTDNPRALWQRDQIDRDRVMAAPERLLRVVVGVDPAVTSDEDSDETGIIAVGMDARPTPHFYVLQDLSGIFSAEQWGRKALLGYRDNRADRIVGEANNGGDLVEFVIRNANVEGLRGANASYKKVTASRGKAIRAEPVAALAEQGRLHHVGDFPQLEDQLVDWDPTDDRAPSPDRLDALVWAVTELMGGPAGMVINPEAIRNLGG
jgi:phage terminase large subunit-like protein